MKIQIMKLSSILLIALKIVLCSSSSTTTRSSYPEIHHRNWTRSEKLDPNGILNLQWYLRNNDIVFQVILNSRGFVAIGFPYPNPRIKGFDVVFAWVNDKTAKANILDCHGINSKFEESSIVKDDTQNYVLESEGYQNLTHTIITFRRTLETCDPRDVPFSADTMQIYWAYGERDVTQIENIKFSSKGQRPIYLLNPSFKKTKKDNFHWDFTMKNVSISKQIASLYWCKVFEAPKLDQKNQIIGFEPIITKGNHVHHMTLFECKISQKHKDSEASLKTANELKLWVKSNGLECSSNLYSSGNWDSCVTPVATYSFGGSAQYLPEHVGIPFQQSYYMLEIHYENPYKESFSDRSGFRIHYTNNLRPYDAGIMITGITISDTQLIPPRQKLFKNIGICGPSCTENVFPEEGINIISVSMHTHKSGRNVKLSHIRNGTEISRIVEDNNYNYNYQEVRQLANETKVLPGDFMILECAYNTKDLKRPTLGGYSLNEEICLSFVMYYPIIELVGCYSMVPVKEFFEYFNVHAFHGMSMTDVENIILYGLEDNSTENSSLPNEIKSSIAEDKKYYQNSILTKLIISDPVEFHDRTFLSHLKQLPWNDQSFAQQFENVMSAGSYMLFCRVSNKSISVPQEIIKFPNFTAIQDATEKLCPYYIYQGLLSSGASTYFVKFIYLYSLLILCLHTMIL